MKLRIKLALLAVGSIIIPVLVTAFAGTLSYRYVEKRKPITPYKIDKIAEHFESELATWHNRANISEPLQSPPEIPEDLHMFVVDRDRNVLFSNIPELSIGEISTSQFPFLDLGIGALERHSLSIPLLVDGSVLGNLVIRFPPRPLQDKKGPPLQVRIFERSAIGLGTFFVFAVIMVLIIMKSINRSIRDLDMATRMVAEGDLDFKLEPQGKDEFASLTESFESMRKELKESQEQRSRFLMGISHDLKTPLTSIEGYLEAIEDGITDNPEMVQKYLAIIRDKSKVLEERIVQLIDYVRMERGEWEIQKKEINLTKYLRDLAAMYMEDIPVFKKSFNSNIDLPEEYRVLVDISLLNRAFENLVANALQYTREGDTITLEARHRDSNVIVTLRDSGPGIPITEKEKIFEPFYRGTASRREQGTGLGLSVVKSIINTHGWSLDVKSAPNKGTEFTINIKAISIR